MALKYLITGLLAGVGITLGAFYVANTKVPYNVTGVPVGVVYYPYTVSLDRNIASPIPAFFTFDTDRMIADLEGMQKAGVTFALISIDENQIPDTSLYQTFFDLADTYGIKLCFMIENPDSTTSLDDLVVWVDQFRLHPAYYLWKGMPLLVLYDCFADENYDNINYTVRHTIYTKQWRWLGIDGIPYLSTVDRMVIIYPGILNVGGFPDQGWRFERTNGDFYKNQWEQIKLMDPEIILVATWNDFWEGTFIQDNSLDGELMSQITATKNNV